MRLPYWINHGLIALAITLVTLLAPKLALVSAGMWFYIGREIRDVEKLHNWNWKKFDWPGMALPVLLTVLLWLIQ